MAAAAMASAANQLRDPSPLFLADVQLCVPDDERARRSTAASTLDIALHKAHRARTSSYISTGAAGSSCGAACAAVVAAGCPPLLPPPAAVAAAAASFAAFAFLPRGPAGGLRPPAPRGARGAGLASGRAGCQLPRPSPSTMYSSSTSTNSTPSGAPPCGGFGYWLRIRGLAIGVRGGAVRGAV